MSLRSKTLLFLGILVILTALIVGTYHELIVNATSLKGSDAPLLTPGSPIVAYPAAVNSGATGSSIQAYPDPPPNTAGKLNLLPRIPERRPF